MKNLIKKSHNKKSPLGDGGKISHNKKSSIGGWGCPEALPSGWIYTSLSGMSESRNPQRKRLKAFDMPNPTATPRASSNTPLGGGGKSSSPWGRLGGAFAFLLFCLFFSQKINAQAAGTPYPTPKGCTNVATQGQDFWVSFGDNGSVSGGISNLNLVVQLNNSNSSPVTVTLTFTAAPNNPPPYGNTNHPNTARYTVPASSSLQVPLNNVTLTDGSTANSMIFYVAQRATTANVSNLTLHITSSAVISVVAFTSYAVTDAATVLLPTNIWGTDYYNLSYPPISNFGARDVNMVIANQPNTNVYINGSSTPAATLGTGQVYYAPSASDLTGTHITTDKPAAFFVHNSNLLIFSNANNGSYGLLFQQLMPTPEWGQYFLVPNETTFGTTDATRANLVRVLALKNNTHVNFTNAVSVNGSDGYTLPGSYVNPGAGGSAVSSVTLQAGQWTEVQISGGLNSYCSISSDNPIAVVDLMKSAIFPVTSGYSFGATNLCRISPVTSLIPTAVIAPFLPPYNGISSQSAIGVNTTGYTPRHYALIISPTLTKDNVIISRNGVSLGTLTAAAGAASQNAVDPSVLVSPPYNIISAATAWQSAGTINGVDYSYIRYDLNFKNDKTATYRITAPDFANGGGILITQVGVASSESYTFTSGAGGCLVNY